LTIFDCKITGEIKCGIPNFQIPPFTIQRPKEEFTPSNWTDSDSYNQSSYDVITFPEILKDMGPGMILVPVIAILEQVAVAKAFSKRSFFFVFECCNLVQMSLMHCGI
jgi:sodium-independent sulfate anion transporter 11